MTKPKTIKASLRLSKATPGDVVAWDLGNGRLHIGMVADVKVEGQPRYAMVHNIGMGAKLEDVLFVWKIIGHYRW